MSELKTERIFILVIIGALVLFGGMVFIFSGANTASVVSKTGALKCGVNEPCNVQPSSGTIKTAGTGTGVAQDVYIKALSSGSYDKSEVTVKKGVPVNLHFSAESGVACGRYFQVYGMDNVNALSKNGEEVVVNFTPQKEGTYEYSCGMRMFRPGKLVVVP